uniref:Uncharacterized protein n=1 Tax=Hyaloperonospora arabidopsidis (strain Emoy2) TaxID=559515 RepID=M4B1Z4_HYAAE
MLSPTLCHGCLQRLLILRGLSKTRVKILHRHYMCARHVWTPTVAHVYENRHLTVTKLSVNSGYLYTSYGHWHDNWLSSAGCSHDSNFS